MNIEDTITRIYVEVDDFCKRELSGKALESRGFDPSLSDAEVLTMEIVGELQGRHDDKAIWRYCNEHGRGWFPNLGDYNTNPSMNIPMGLMQAVSAMREFSVFG